LTASGKERAVALVSGGLDSVVSLAQALNDLEVRLVLFFNYEQRALDRERNAVLGVVNYYQLPFREVDLSWLGSLAPEAMRRDGYTGEHGTESGLNDVEAVWIPNRNGVFLNAAAAYAESYRCRVVVTGFNKEEAAEFPDNSGRFVDRMNACLRLSTLSGVRIVSFTQRLNKREILLLGAKLRAPLSVIWSCYRGGELMCGTCASCGKLKSALRSLPEEKRPVLRFEA
jgi:7-cyano-7-deazaguanine synthase